MPRTKPGTWTHAVEISSLSVALLFLIELVDYLAPWTPDIFGIIPRTLRGLIGIIFSPLLHYNFAHLTANAAPLFVLLVLLFWDRRYDPERAIISIWLASGFGTWLIGRGYAIHIGASGIIYGLVVYLIAAGWWMRNWRAATVAILVLVFYGGIFYGVLPHQGHVSWEGHLAGAVAGWWVARRHHGN
ncbi:MAG: rhomboid family intramembrane serine protease [Verrucomicrobia bacterium]|nr:rhomboid family intramembrane serine protease [Verrucomicrobiota bacterium]